jgi:membrane-associated phospholipid phosphatase
MIALLATLCAAADTEALVEVSPWRVRSPTITYHWLPETLGSAALFGGYFALRSIGPRDTTGVADPGGLDAIGHPRWDESAQFPSDVFGDPRTLGVLNVPWFAAIGAGVYGGLSDDSAAAGAAHGLIVIESIAASIAITEVLKLSISRPRPYTSEAFQEAWPEAYEEGHFAAWKSMPSGHTSTAAAASFSAATLVMMHGGSPALRAGVLTGATAITATTGYLRVRAGVHHPTDTIVGGLLGAGVGMGNAWLHRSREPVAVGDARLDGLRLSGGERAVSLSLDGRF